MWSFKYLSRTDYKVIPVVMILFIVSLLVMSSYGVSSQDVSGSEEGFFTPKTRIQLQWICLGWGAYFFFAGFDYSKLREWAWISYIITLIALVGLFLVDPHKNVHRWYRIPILNLGVQPSQSAMLVIVITLSWFLEKRRSNSRSFSTAFYSAVIVGIPFLLILKQPDLGSALLLIPITIAMFYFGGVHPRLIKVLLCFGAMGLLVVGLIFSGLVPHETLKPYATKVIKEYQYERLNPDSYQQKAAMTAIGVGGVSGKGWRMSEYARRGWLPEVTTDSVFPAFGEEFGLIGLGVILLCFYALIHLSFRVVAVAKDYFACVLAAGIAVYLTVHIVINISMMIGLFPITGVPLLFITYGGSSMLSTMSALGVLQSIYSRRFMF